MFRSAIALGLSALALSACDGGGVREQIMVVGSSTVYPFTTAVAERFVNNGDRRAPVIESTGTGAGFDLFCQGIGPEYADLQNASRRIHRDEFEKCRANGVREVMEIQVGSDGLAIAQAVNGPAFDLSRRDVYLALAANPMGQPNRARLWSDVNPSLPAIPINVLGPPSTSGTRDSFNELILIPGCKDAYPAAASLSGEELEAACQLIRSDGPYVDAGENDNLIVQKLTTDPNAVGIFGFSYLEENASRVRGIPIDGVTPSYDTVSSGSYPGARPLFVYAKKRHVRAVPGLGDFLVEYARSWDPGGPLTKRGMIAAPADVRQRSAAIVRDGITMTGEQLK